MNALQARENAQFLQVHVSTVHRGLQAILDLLDGVPDGRAVQASSVRALLLPLADEASQAEPLTRLMAPSEEMALQ